MFHHLFPAFQVLFCCISHTTDIQHNIRQNMLYVDNILWWICIIAWIKSLYVVNKIQNVPEVCCLAVCVSVLCSAAAKHCLASICSCLVSGLGSHLAFSCHSFPFTTDCSSFIIFSDSRMEPAHQQDEEEKTSQEELEENLKVRKVFEVDN